MHRFKVTNTTVLSPNIFGKKEKKIHTFIYKGNEKYDVTYGGFNQCCGTRTGAGKFWWNRKKSSGSGLTYI